MSQIGGKLFYSFNLAGLFNGFAKLASQSWLISFFLYTCTGNQLISDAALLFSLKTVFYLECSIYLEMQERLGVGIKTVTIMEHARLTRNVFECLVS